MARHFPDAVEVLSGPLFMEHDWEDGPRETYLIQIGATVAGRDYVLRGFDRRPSHRIEAEALRDRILDRGTIDLALWDLLPPRLSLEERFDIYAQNEAEVRMGCRSEEDLYHGV